MRSALRRDKVCHGESLAEGRYFSQELLHLLDNLHSAVMETVSLIRSVKVVGKILDFRFGQVFDEGFACEVEVLSLTFADHLIDDAVPLLADGLCPFLNADAARLNEAAEASGLEAILAENLIDLRNSERVERSLLDKTSLAESVDDSLVCLSLLADHQKVDVDRVVAVAHQSRKNSLASLQIGGEGSFADLVLLDEFLVKLLHKGMLTVHDGHGSFDVLFGVSLQSEGCSEDLSASLVPCTVVKEYLSICGLTHQEFTVFVYLDGGVFAERITHCRIGLTCIDERVHPHGLKLLKVIELILHESALIRVRIKPCICLLDLGDDTRNEVLDLLPQGRILRLQICNLLDSVAIGKHSLTGVSDNLFVCLVKGKLSAILGSLLNLPLYKSLYRYTLLGVVLKQEVGKDLEFCRRPVTDEVGHLMGYGVQDNALAHLTRVEVDVDASIGRIIETVRSFLDRTVCISVDAIAVFVQVGLVEICLHADRMCQGGSTLYGIVTDTPQASLVTEVIFLSVDEDLALLGCSIIALLLGFRSCLLRFLYDSLACILTDRISDVSLCLGQILSECTLRQFGLGKAEETVLIGILEAVDVIARGYACGRVIRLDHITCCFCGHIGDSLIQQSLGSSAEADVLGIHLALIRAELDLPVLDGSNALNLNLFVRVDEDGLAIVGDRVFCLCSDFLGGGAVYGRGIHFLAHSNACLLHSEVVKTFVVRACVDAFRTDLFCPLARVFSRGDVFGSNLVCYALSCIAASNDGLLGRGELLALRMLGDDLG